VVGFSQVGFSALEFNMKRSFYNFHNAQNSGTLDQVPVVGSSKLHRSYCTRYVSSYINLCAGGYVIDFAFFTFESSDSGSDV